MVYPDNYQHVQYVQCVHTAHMYVGAQYLVAGNKNTKYTPNIDKHCQSLTDKPLLKNKRAFSHKHKSFLKPERPYTGLGDTNRYTNIILIDQYVLV